MQLVVEKADAGKRLDAFLHERLAEFSRSRLQSWIKIGHVLVDGSPVKASHLLRGREIIAVTPAELAPLKAFPQALPLRILYEDAGIVVVDKPPGMVVHAGAGHSEGTLVNALLHHFKNLSSLNGDLRPGIVHRLDRDTSGVMVAARTDAAHQELARQFQERSVEKTYLALVERVPRRSEGRIETPIARDPVRRTRMTTRLASGRHALTAFETIQTFAGEAALLRVRIGTGRTHQIRVHLASIGHPVVGDRLYGASAKPGLSRFFLHSSRLGLSLPGTGERKSFESPLPDDLESYLRDLRASFQTRLE